MMFSRLKVSCLWTYSQEVRNGGHTETRQLDRASLFNGATFPASLQCLDPAAGTDSGPSGSRLALPTRKRSEHCYAGEPFPLRTRSDGLDHAGADGTEWLCHPQTERRR